MTSVIGVTKVYSYNYTTELARWLYKMVDVDESCASRMRRVRIEML